MLIPDLLRKHASSQPERTAIIVDGRASISYRRWEEQSNALARGLRARGVRPGDRVGLIFNDAQWLDVSVAYIGIQKAGGVVVTLSTRFSKYETACMLEHSAACGVLASPGIKISSFSGWVESTNSLAEGQGSTPFQIPVEPYDDAGIVYTSGTTGSPKGVVYSHGNVTGTQTGGDWLPAGREEQYLIHAYPFHTGSGLVQLLRPILDGMPTVVMSSVEPQHFDALVSEYDIVAVSLPPAAASMLLDSDIHKNYRLSSLRRISLSTAPVSAILAQRLAEMFPQASIRNAYGTTETSPAGTACYYGMGHINSVGRPVGRSQVRITDDAGQELKAGEVGEIWLRYPGVPQRTYYRDPDAAAQVFHNGWGRTGDLGYVDGEGYLYLIDRKKDLVNCGGFKVSTIEVESVLCQHPAVAEAAVFGLRHEVLGECSAAAIVSRSAIAESELRTFVNQRLADYKVPQVIIMLKHLPKNPGGKVAKRELQRYAQDKLPQYGKLAMNTLPLVARVPDAERNEEAAYGPYQLRANVDSYAVEPIDALEAEITKIWEEVLGVGPIGRRSNFFYLGGHSLLSKVLLTKIEQRFGRELPQSILFTAPTVELFADVLREKVGAGSRSSLVPIQVSGYKAPVFCVPPLHASGLSYCNLALHLGPEQPLYVLLTEGESNQKNLFGSVPDLAAHYLKEIYSLQPKGPYFIGGWCFGGMIAFEMSQQLFARGEEVSLLFMIDTIGPVYPPIARRVRFHLGKLMKLGLRDSWKYVLVRAKANGDRIMKGFLSTINNFNSRLGWRRPSSPDRLEGKGYVLLDGDYLPGKYPGKITLFSSTEQYDPHPDPANGWTGIAVRGVERHWIDGSHSNLFEEPAVGHLAEALRQSLAKTQNRL